MNTKRAYIIALLLMLVGIGAILFGEFVAVKQQPPQGSGNVLTYSAPKGWHKVTQDGISFYIPNIATTYMSLADWPPHVQRLDEPYSCIIGGSEVMEDGSTTELFMDGRVYCATVESEGAAGSVYRTYTYVFPFNNASVSLTFTLRFVQCVNYDEPQQLACRDEQATWNTDAIHALALQMIQTIIKPVGSW